MKIVGTVSPEEVPEEKGRIGHGLWTDLGREIVAEHEKGRVLKVQTDNEDERKRMINGVSEILRKSGYSRRFTTVQEGDQLVVYCRLVDRVAEQPVEGPFRRVRRKARG